MLVLSIVLVVVTKHCQAFSICFNFNNKTIAVVLHLFILCFVLVYGKNVRTVAYTTFSEEEDIPNGQQMVTYEARKLKCLLLKLQDY